MIFRQFLDESLGQASYLVGCGGSKTAVVVDPNASLGPDFYVLEAADRGVEIRGVIETHVHADFLSCARQLAADADAPHYLYSTAAVDYPFEPLQDGQILHYGKVELQILHTPGHTPEHIALLVTDRSRGPDPLAVLTGDSLLIGDVGRPDLLMGDAAIDAAGEMERATQLFQSICGRLLVLPDWVEVFPGHYGGSACGGSGLSGQTSSTIGAERRYNGAARHDDVDAFVRHVTGTRRPHPADYRAIKAANLGRVAESVAHEG